MAKDIRVDFDFGNVSKILNLPNATQSGQPVTWDQLNAAIEGLSFKDSARVSTQSNINLASPGAAIDGITMVLNDRVLVRSQTSQPLNGLYIWNGAAVAMTRSIDANTAPELEQAIVTVEEGTDAGATFRQTQVNFVLDTNNVLWTAFGTSAPAASETTAGIAELATQAETDAGTDDARMVTPLKLKTSTLTPREVIQNIGDGSATQYDVTHNFNTRDIKVSISRNATPWDEIECGISKPDANTVRLNFVAAPTSNQFRVIVSLR